MGNFSFGKKKLFKKVIQVNSINPLGVTPFQALSANWSLEPVRNLIQKVSEILELKLLSTVWVLYKLLRINAIACDLGRNYHELWSIGLTDIKSSFIASEEL